ncbi:MAG: nuclear transport factor 2 family protein [Bryobacteraceae bacterium]
MKTIRILTMLLLLPAAVLLAQGGDKEIREAEKSWVSAVQSGDEAALNKILSSDLIYTHATGLVESKAEYLKALSSGNQKYASIEHLDMVVKRFGDTAVVAAKVRMTGSTKGTPFDNQLRMLHVWNKKGGQWQLVAHQTTRLP